MQGKAGNTAAEPQAGAASARLTRELEYRGIAAALLFEPDNIRFCAGYRSESDASLHYPECWALVAAGGQAVVWDHPDSAGRNDNLPFGVERRYASGWDWLGPPSDGGVQFVDAVVRVLEQFGSPTGPVAVDRAAPLVYSGLAEAGVRVCDAGELLVRSRMVKSDAEIMRLHEACMACDAALTQAGAAIEPGMPGYAVWKRFADAAMSAGAEACLPPPGLDSVLRAGDLVSIDGCMVGKGGFAAHLSTTFACGDADTGPLTAAERELASLVATCVPGRRFSDLSVPGAFVHGCGVVAEPPALAEFPVITPSGAPDGVLGEGMVLSVGRVLPGAGGRPGLHVRDQVLVTVGSPLSLRAGSLRLPVSLAIPTSLFDIAYSSYGVQSRGSASMTASVRGSVDTADVVVVGGGDAGLIASIEAADLGASVILLQKNAEVGGKSSWAIGSVTAGGTSLQAARGIQDSPEAHREDIMAWARKHGADSLPMEKLGLLIDNIPAAVERLLELGVTFSGPHPEEMHRCYRMHVFSPHPMAVVSLLGLRARERGVHIRCDSAAEELLTDGDGRVIGVRTRDRTVLARRAVVVASGDYSAPRPNGEGLLGNEFAFRPWASGDGQFMAAEVGAGTEWMDLPLRLDLRMIDWPHLRPEPFLFEHGALLVTRSGKRVANELDLHGLEVASKVHEDLFVVLDAALAGRLATAADDSPHARDGWLLHDKLHLGTYPGVGYAYMQDVLDAAQAHHGSIPEVAAALNIDGDALEEEIAAFGSAMRGETPDPFGRPAGGRALDGGPYLVLGPGRYRCFNGQAAISCDLRMHALRPDGSPVPGLFVAGNAATRANVGYAVGGHGYGLGWALVSGRIAGTEAAQCAAVALAAR